MRLKTWTAGLAEVVEHHRAIPFEWGVSDCLAFPLNCVKAITGRDVAAEYDRYDSQLDAYRILKSLGFETVADAFAAHFPEISPSMMGRGDLASVTENGAVCGVVCIGAQIVGKGMSGLTFVPRSIAQRAFKVE